MIGQRSAQLLEQGIDSVLEIFLFLLRLVAELAALVAFAVIFCVGFNLLVLGDDAMSVVGVAGMSVGQVVADFSGTGGGESSGVGTRIFGLGLIMGSMLAGYFVLFTVYVFHDYANIIYRFFNDIPKAMRQRNQEE